MAVRLAAVDLEVQPLQGELGYRLGPELEIRAVQHPNPTMPGLLDGSCFTRCDGAEVWRAVQHHIPASPDVSL